MSTLYLSSPTTASEGGEIVLTATRDTLDPHSTDYFRLFLDNSLGGAYNTASPADITPTGFSFGDSIAFAPGELTKELHLRVNSDVLAEGNEYVQFRAVAESPGAFFPMPFASTLIKDVAPQNVTVTMLDPSITVTEGQTAVIRMAISGNDRGGSFELPFDTGGSQINPFVDFTNDNPTYAAYKVTLTPGQTYAEFRMNMTEDTLRENDKTNTFGAVRNNNTGFTPLTSDTFIRFEGTTAVTLRDNDWGATPTTPSVVINGNNNIINQNTYVDNRVYTNSFNVSDSYNQTYTNSFNGSGGKDTITGTTGNDQLAGLKGNDVLRGAQGNDAVIGGAGNDNLFGGIGRNILVGGTGRDVLNVTAEGNAAQADILKNFAAGDHINVIGGTSLTFQTMQDGIGIFNNGILQALATGGAGLDAVRSATTGV